MSPSALQALAVSAGAFCAGLLFVWGASGWPRSCARSYATWVERHARDLFLGWTAARFAATHAGGSALAAVLGASIGGWALGVVLFVVAAALGFRWFAALRRLRRSRLETQIDPMLRNMAQTLRVTANLAEAVETVAQQLDAPMSQEMDLCLRQYRLGLPIEEALRQTGERTGSESMGTIATAILIARTTGGDLPRVLDEAAAVLRERVRLDGIVDAKTAEGRAQAWVMGIVPPVLAAALWKLDPDMMRPLFEDPVGYLVLAIVVLLEAAGVWGVRRVTTIEA